MNISSRLSALGSRLALVAIAIPTLAFAQATQPARHNEFDVNLAFLEAKIDGAGVRGRFALQTGTSVRYLLAVSSLALTF